MAGLKAPLAPAAALGHCPVPGDAGVSQVDLPGALGPRLGRQLRERELERQKARALQLSWKLQQPLSKTPKELEATPHVVWAELEHSEEEVSVPKEEEEKVSEPHPGTWGPGPLRSRLECTRASQG